MVLWRARTEPPAPPAATATPAPAVVSTGHASSTYYIIFGTKGMGKTQLARAIARRRVAAGGRVVWIEQLAKNGDLGVVVRNGPEFWARVRPALKERKGFSIVVQPGWGKERELDRLWRLVFEIGNVLLVLDEAHLVAPISSIDAGLGRLVSAGRNNQIDIVATTQTVAQLNPILRRLNDVVVTFRQVDRNAAETLNSDFFHLPDGERRIMALDRFQYLRVENSAVTMGRVPAPR